VWRYLQTCLFLVTALVWVGLAWAGGSVDLDQLNLQGEVRSLEMYWVPQAEVIQEMKRADLQLSYRERYDTRGRLIEEDDYASDGSLEWKTTYRYDQRDRVTELLEYDGDGSLEWKTTYRYGNHGKIVEQEVHGADGERIWATFYEYSSDHRGDLREGEAYALDGSLARRVRFDLQGNLVEETGYWLSGAPIWKRQYRYDDSGNEVERAQYDYGRDPNGVLTMKRTLRYDHYGRLIEMTNYDPNDLPEARTSFSYDEQGNRVAEVTYDRDGEITSSISYRYHYDGHANWVRQEGHEDFYQAGERQYGLSWAWVRDISYY
jgi:YD repeat-containing protein